MPGRASCCAPAPSAREGNSHHRLPRQACHPASRIPAAQERDDQHRPGGHVLHTLVVGDTLNFSVRQDAYRTLGPVDKRVIAPPGLHGRTVTERLTALTGNPDVDGVLDARATQASGVSRSKGRRVAEPRALAWQMDFDEASRFGVPAGESGLAGPNPRPGQVVINTPLAQSLRVGAGEPITLYLFGTPHTYRVDRVVPEQGLASVGLGGRLNRDAFLAPGTLDAAARAAGTEPRTVTFVSNRGGGESGDSLTAHQHLRPGRGHLRRIAPGHCGPGPPRRLHPPRTRGPRGGLSPPVRGFSALPLASHRGATVRHARFPIHRGSQGRRASQAPGAPGGNARRRSAGPARTAGGLHGCVALPGRAAVQRR